MPLTDQQIVEKYGTSYGLGRRPTEEFAEDPTWGDYGRLIATGGVQMGSGIGWLFNNFDWGRSLQEKSQKLSGEIMEGLSPQAKKALETEFLERDEGQLWTNNKWSKAKLTAAQSLLGTAAGMGLGAVLTRGLMAAGMARTATTAAGGTVQVPTKTAGAIGYGLGEAGVAAPAGAAGVEEELKAMSHDDLYANAIDYRAVYDSLEGTPEDRERRAKEYLAKAAAGDAFAMNLVSTFLLSAPLGAVVGGYTGKLPLAATRPRSIATGAAGEAGQEFLQSGAEAIGANIAMQQADPTRSPFEGALEEAVGGAMAGGLMGGGFGMVTPTEMPETAPPTPDDSPLATLVQQPETVEDTLTRLAAELTADLAEIPGTDENIVAQRPMDPLDWQLQVLGETLERDLGAEQAKFEDMERLDQAEAAAREARRRQKAAAYEQRRVDEEIAALMQRYEQEQEQASQEVSPRGGEMVTPRGQPVGEQELIDIIGGQPVEGSRLGEYPLHEAGGRPAGTSLGEALRAAGVRPEVQRPPDDEGPGGGGAASLLPYVSPDAAPVPNARDTRAAEALEAEEAERQAREQEAEFNEEARLEREAIAAEEQPPAEELEDIPFAEDEFPPTPEVEWADERLADRDYHRGLDRLISETQAGGGIALIPDMDQPGVTSPEEATWFAGRTPSTNPPWMQSIVSEEKVGRDYVIGAVEKAKAGKRLGAKQKRIVQAMLDEIDQPSEYAGQEESDYVEMPEGATMLPTEQVTNLRRETTNQELEENEDLYLGEMEQDIRENGWKDPIEVGLDERGNPDRVIQGNHRLAVAARLNLPEVPVIYISDDVRNQAVTQAQRINARLLRDPSTESKEEFKSETDAVEFGKALTSLERDSWTLVEDILGDYYTRDGHVITIVNPRRGMPYMQLRGREAEVPERAAPPADLDRPGDIFTDMNEQDRQQRRAQTDIEERQEVPVEADKTEAGPMAGLTPEQQEKINKLVAHGSEGTDYLIAETDDNRYSLYAAIEDGKLVFDVLTDIDSFGKYDTYQEAARIYSNLSGEALVQAEAPRIPPDPQNAEFRDTKPMYDEVLSRMDFRKIVPFDEAKVGDTVLDPNPLRDDLDPRVNHGLILDIHPETGSKLFVGLQTRGPLVDPARGNRPVTHPAGLYFSSHPYQMYGVAHDTDYETLDDARVEFRKAGDQQTTAEREEIEDAIEEETHVDAEGNVTFYIDEEEFAEELVEWERLMEAPPAGEKAIDVQLKDAPFIPLEEAQARVDEWRQHAIEQGTANPENQRKIVLSLFDVTGNWARPWAEAGYQVYTFDIKSGQDVMDFSVGYFADEWGGFGNDDVYAILAAPPCTTFANSATRWRKSRHDAKSREWIEQMWGEKAAQAVDDEGKPLFETPHEYAIEMVNQTLRTIEYFRPVVWALENPTGRIESDTILNTKWRTGFQPSNFGDPYTKRTMLWGRFNADMPTANVDPVEGSKMHKMSPSEERAAMRSETPEGFAYAFFMANNFADRDPVERTIDNYPDTAGAIRQAFKAGLTERQIRDVLENSWESDNPSVGQQALREAIKNKRNLPDVATSAPGEVKNFKLINEINGITQARLKRISNNFAKVGDQFMGTSIGGRPVITTSGVEINFWNDGKGNIHVKGVTLRNREQTVYDSDRPTHVKEALIALDKALQNAVGHEAPTKTEIETAKATGEIIDVAGYQITLQDRPDLKDDKSEYGEIRRTEGADGDPIDVFVNKDAAPRWAGNAYIIDQVDEDGNFDEHKVMLGYNNLIDARRSYQRAYGRKVKPTNITKMTLDEFDAWLAEPGANKRPATKSGVTEAGRKARKDDNDKLRYSVGRDLFNALDEDFVKAVLGGDERKMGDVPDTVPLNIAVSELLAIEEQQRKDEKLAATKAEAVTPEEMFPPGRVEKEVGKINEEFPGANIEVVSRSNIQDRLKAGLLPTLETFEEKIEDLTVPAMYDPDSKTIYIFKDRIMPGTNLRKLALHEMFHKGLDNMFDMHRDPKGRVEYNALMDDIYNRVPDKHKPMLKRIENDYKLDNTVPEDRRIAAEELVADLAERNVKDGIVARAIRFVRNFLERIGVITKEDAWTNEDIRKLIAEAHGAIAAKDRTSRVTLTEEVLLGETGEVYEVEMPAAELLNEIEQRKAICEKVRACL